MRSLREGVYPKIGMTGKCVAGGGVCGSGAVTKSATVVGNVDGMRWVWRGAVVEEVVAVMVSRGSRGFVGVVYGRRAVWRERKVSRGEEGE